ncbi:MULTISPECIES: Bpu10I family restriction endonuclease [Spirulina sp. CCY15215]|uniref:Bpu10I family restriction endonuclease n=1 Tax=Spirulina sp. CCY15215 TaxID=2767591 RepID=UPI00194EC039|nr:Bpu10I family restriction endonuclease [Spirulina major]
MKEFDKPIPQELLNIVDKKRKNLFTWRGQFSPQLIETFLKFYCLPDSIVLDPFAGSGTVLFESGNLSLVAYGFEINPAALLMSKTYEFINKSNKKDIIDRFREKLEREFPVKILIGYGQTIENLEAKIWKIGSELDRETKILFEALIILLDLGKNQITSDFIQKKLFCLVKIIEGLSFSQKAIKVDFSDARQLPIHNDIVDFVITSPPYINVFNYHQNYRKSVEILGWDVLKIAKSEIGSNRANRGNRFYTVVQYCLDMADVLQELSRVSKKFARIVLIVGYESKVLGVPFNNADIRQEYKTPEARHIHRSVYEEFLDSSKYYADVFQRMIDKIQTIIDDSSPSIDRVLDRGHF